MKSTRRGLLGGLLAGLVGVFVPRQATPAVMWEEPEDESDLPPLDEDEDEETSSSSVSSCILPDTREEWRVDYTTGKPFGQLGL